MKNIVIIGAGDLGKEVVWLIEDINKKNPTYVILGFLDDTEEKMGKVFYGYKVLGTINDLDKIASDKQFVAVIAIQDCAARRKIVEEHKDFEAWETIIHPFSVIADTSSIGRGSIVFPQVTISVDSKLGDFGLYYIQSTICNDCIIGDYVSIMSGSSVSERSIIGDECFLAAGCTIYPRKKIGRGVVVGVEATVNKDYSDYSEVYEKGIGFTIFK